MAKINLQSICIKILTCFIVSVLLFRRTEGYSLNKHMEVDKVAHNCPELDKCNYGNESRVLSPEIEKNCACDIACNEFGDCCVDAPIVKADKSDTKCYDVRGFGGVYMISGCPDAYDGDETWRESCEDMDVADPSDPMGSVPVTDYETGVTYKNVYCKMCNGKFDLMKFWKTKLDCPFLSSFNESHSITEEYVMKNLVKKDENWGLNLRTVDGMFFLECNIETVIPSDLRDKIRRCQPNLISNCPLFWENEIIREKCKSYQAPRYTDDGDGYRNVYCAICNNENAADLSCISPQAENIKLFRFSVSHSFAVLLDVNTKKGERVGMIRLCKNGDVFDPFFKKCRELQCLPGFVRRGRKCFPRRSVSRTVRKPTKYRKIYASTSKPYTSTSKPYTTTSKPYTTTSKPYTTTSKIYTSIDSRASSSSSSASVSYIKGRNTIPLTLYETNLYTTTESPLASKADVYIQKSSNTSTGLYKKL